MVAATMTRAETLAKELSEQTRELLRLSDDEILQKAYDLAGQVEREHVDSDQWYWILGEIFERFAPEAELRNFERGWKSAPATLGEADAAIEIAASRQSFYERQAARLAFKAARGED